MRASLGLSGEIAISKRRSYLSEKPIGTGFAADVAIRFWQDLAGSDRTRKIRPDLVEPSPFLRHHLQTT